MNIRPGAGLGLGPSGFFAVVGCSTAGPSGSPVIAGDDFNSPAPVTRAPKRSKVSAVTFALCKAMEPSTSFASALAAVDTTPSVA